MAFNLLEFYGSLQNQGIIFCFSGPISQDIIEGIGTTLRQKMQLEETDLNATQRVFAIFVEQMQNIVNYSAERVAPPDQAPPDMRVGVLIVGQDQGRFYVVCGNKIVKEDMEPLAQQLSHLRGLDKDQLKAFYRERRKMPIPAESKGSGLGFIDMARRAGRPLEFEFAPIDDTHVFFSIKAVI
ncbi:MAG: SiaB family protein kinase [Thermodesulfobacteriota bacterium]